MENLFSQFSNLEKHGPNQKDTISIPNTRTSYDLHGRHIMRVRLGLQCSDDDLNRMADTLAIEKSELIVMLSSLMHLASTKYVEEAQAGDRSNILLTQSGENIADLNGNL
jgi:hypothetical protein